MLLIDISAKVNKLLNWGIKKDMGTLETKFRMIASINSQFL